MKYLAILIPALLTGCATDPATVQTLVAAQQAANARPTLALECPAGGCKFEYTDPRDRQQLRMPTNGWVFVPDDMRATLPHGAVQWLTFGLLVAGIAGRLVDQKAPQ